MLTITLGDIGVTMIVSTLFIVSFILPLRYIILAKMGKREVYNKENVEIAYSLAWIFVALWVFGGICYLLSIINWNYEVL